MISSKSVICIENHYNQLFFNYLYVFKIVINVDSVIINLVLLIKVLSKTFCDGAV